MQIFFIPKIHFPPQPDCIDKILLWEPLGAPLKAHGCVTKL